MTSLQTSLDTRASSGSSLGWALFLGVSWTWCIGMFLPVLLVRDLGYLGWVVFAVPNVLGAAAMGWVLRTAEASQRLVQRHRAACVAFSLVTIAFHVFFILWMIGGRLHGLRWPVGLLAFALPILVRALAQQRRSHLAATLVYLLSLGAFAFVGWYMLGHDLPAITPPSGRAAITRSLQLAPVCIFGFLLCPYLDLTFHRARQMTSPGAARMAFSLGFGLVFLLMIAFSLVYAAPLASVLQPHGNRLPMIFALVLAIHMLGQACFTMAEHMRQIPELFNEGGRGRVGLLMVVAAAALGGLVLTPAQWLGMDSGEIIYRLFLSFYGLGFPAYVWLCMIPLGRREVGPHRRNLVVLAISILVASPLFWMGFIHNRMIWLLPGVAVVLASRLLIPRSSAAASF